MNKKKYPITDCNVTMNSDGTIRAELNPNYFTYKKYFGSTRYSEEDEVYYGKILGISDFVNYESEDLESLKIQFEKAVDDYLETCLSLNRSPDFPIPYKTPTDKDIDEYYDIYEFLYDEYGSGENEDYIELLWCFISQHKDNFFDDEQQIKVEIEYKEGFIAKALEMPVFTSRLINNSLVCLTSDFEEKVGIHIKKNRKNISNRFGISYYPTTKVIDYIKNKHYERI